MALFDDLLAGGIGLLGARIASGQRSDAASLAREAATPVSVAGPQGLASFNGGLLSLGLTPQLQQAMTAAGAGGLGALNNLNSINFQDREMAELERLRTLRRPQIDAARSSLRSRLFNSGRLGLGVGGGLSGGLFQPESQALEEAILRTDLGDIGAARDFARGDERFLADQASRLFGVGSQIQAPLQAQAALGIQSRLPSAIAGLQAQPGFADASTTSGFFSGLGTALGNSGVGGALGNLLGLGGGGGAAGGGGGIFSGLSSLFGGGGAGAGLAAGGAVPGTVAGTVGPAAGFAVPGASSLATGTAATGGASGGGGITGLAAGGGEAGGGLFGTLTGGQLASLGIAAIPTLAALQAAFTDKNAGIEAGQDALLAAAQAGQPVTVGGQSVRLQAPTPQNPGAAVGGQGIRVAGSPDQVVVSDNSGNLSVVPYASTFQAERKRQQAIQAGIDIRGKSQQEIERLLELRKAAGFVGLFGSDNP